jgi:hypothetical protein
MDDIPEEQSGKLLVAAVTAHEFYTNLLTAGFPDGHALYLTGQLVESMTRTGAS